MALTGELDNWTYQRAQNAFAKLNGDFGETAGREVGAIYEKQPTTSTTNKPGTDTDIEVRGAKGKKVTLERILGVYPDQ